MDWCLFMPIIIFGSLRYYLGMFASVSLVFKWPGRNNKVSFFWHWYQVMHHFPDSRGCIWDWLFLLLKKLLVESSTRISIQRSSQSEMLPAYWSVSSNAYFFVNSSPFIVVLSKTLTINKRDQQHHIHAMQFDIRLTLSYWNIHTGIYSRQNVWDE